MRGVVVGSVLSMVACAAPAPLHVDAPGEGAAARIVVTRTARETRAFAIDGATPVVVPALDTEDEPLVLTAVAYDTPLADLDLEAGPGPIELVDAARGRPLWPATSGHQRIVTGDDDGAWQPISTIEPMLYAAVRPACRTIDAQPLAFPTDLHVTALWHAGDDSATLVAEGGGRRQWRTVRDGKTEVIADPLPGFSVRGGAVGADGTEWVTGARTTTIADDERPELWVRPRGGAFVRVPDSPAMAAGRYDGEIRWLAPTSVGGVWTMTRTGVIERYADGAWTHYHTPDQAFPARNIGALARVDDDRVDALIPAVFSSFDARQIVQVRPDGVVTHVLPNPLPNALVHAPDMGGTVVGTVTGRVYLLGPRGIEELAEQSMGSMVFRVLPTRHGLWRGVMFTGINGYLRELYLGAAVCVPDGLWLNATEAVVLERGWVLAGTTQPPERVPSLAWVSWR